VQKKYLWCFRIRKPVPCSGQDKYNSRQQSHYQQTSVPYGNVQVSQEITLLLTLLFVIIIIIIIILFDKDSTQQLL